MLTNNIVSFEQPGPDQQESAKASQIFSTKNIGVFEILTFEILMKSYQITSLVLNNQAQINKNLQKLLKFFQQKILAYFKYQRLKF